MRPSWIDSTARWPRGVRRSTPFQGLYAITKSTPVCAVLIGCMILFTDQYFCLVEIHALPNRSRYWQKHDSDLVMSVSASNVSSRLSHCCCHAQILFCMGASVVFHGGYYLPFLQQRAPASLDTVHSTNQRATCMCSAKNRLRPTTRIQSMPAQWGEMAQKSRTLENIIPSKRGHVQLLLFSMFSANRLNEGGVIPQPYSPYKPDEQVSITCICMLFFFNVCQ